MKKFEAKITIEVQDDVVAILLDPVQQLAGQVLQQRANEKTEQTTSVPCGIEPNIFVDDIKAVATPIVKLEE